MPYSGRMLPPSGLSRRSLLALATAGGALPLLGLSPARADSKPPAKPTGQVIAGISQEPTVFNPLLLHIEVDEGVYMNLFSPLWSVDPKGNFVPELVSEVPTIANGGISADGLTWRLKLRSGVTWHDGAPFTSADVKYTLDLINDHNFPAFSRSGHELVKDITLVSPTELTWRMDKPFAPYPSILAWTFIVPKHLMEAESDPQKSKFASAPVGTGPFKWSERVPGDHITLVANEKFYGPGPYLERLVFKYIPDLTVLFTQFRTGDIDYIGLQGISADHYAEAKTLKDRTIYLAPQPFIETFSFNLEQPQFKDLAVRQALYASIDKQSIINDVYYGLPTPAESFLPTQAWAFNANLPKQEYSPDKAKKLLDDAGWKPGADGIREKNGVRLEFTNSTTAGNHLREQVQQVLQQGWQDIGIKMTIKDLPPAVMWGDYWMKSQFQTGIAGIDFMSGPDPESSDYFRSSSTPAKGGSGQNTFQFVNAEVDTLLQKGGTTLDQSARAPMYQRMQAIVREELPFLPLFQYSFIEGTKFKLAGYAPNVNVRSNCWNIGTWYWTN
jgi:peptide/nickel transport system substrate-binding protein